MMKTIDIMNMIEMKNVTDIMKTIAMIIKPIDNMNKMDIMSTINLRKDTSTPMMMKANVILNTMQTKAMKKKKKKTAMKRKTTIMMIRNKPTVKKKKNMRMEMKTTTAMMRMNNRDHNGDEKDDEQDEAEHNNNMLKYTNEAFIATINPETTVAIDTTHGPMVVL